MKKTIYSASSVLIIVFGIYSCKKTTVTTAKEQLATSGNNATSGTNNSAASARTYSANGEETTISAPLQNPYTITNMQTAYNTLVQQGEVFPTPLSILETHKYVKFTPDNWEQAAILESDSNLVLFTTPLDCKIITEGNRYHDPNVPLDKPTPLYASVPKTFVFNTNVPYQVISTLYIPEQDNAIKNNADYLDMLLNQAYIQTNNFDDTTNTTVVNTVGKPKAKPSYTPSGQIQSFDDRLNSYIGLYGVTIKARRWFTVYVAQTNSTGNYAMNGSFTKPCNYSLEFKQAGYFTVKEHWYNSEAGINGPKITGAWNTSIPDNTYDNFCANVFRGAYRYHFQSIDGLRRPFRPSNLNNVYVAKNTAKTWNGINWIIYPDIKIARYALAGAEYEADKVFSTTCHETAHTSHVIQMKRIGVVQYLQVSNQIQESWAIGVEWLLTGLEYKNRGITNYGEYTYNVQTGTPNWFAYQFWSKQTLSSDYTTLFINLYDQHQELNQIYQNTLTGTNAGTGTVNDEVWGYTFAYMEANILPYSYGISSLSNQLKTKKTGTFGQNNTAIDNLLNCY